MKAKYWPPEPKVARSNRASPAIVNKGVLMISGLFLFCKNEYLFHEFTWDLKPFQTVIVTGIVNFPGIDRLIHLLYL